MSDAEQIARDKKTVGRLGYKMGASDMRETIAAWCENEIVVAKEEAQEDGERGQGFLTALRHVADTIRALPLTTGDTS